MQIIKALNMAAEAHRNQERRGTGLPYIIHPVTISYLLGKYKVSKYQEELTIAVILHDCPEDTKLTIEEITKIFGMMVGGLVFELTSDLAEIERLGKNQYLMTKGVHMSSYGLTLKLLDRLGNIMDGPTDQYLIDTTAMVKHIMRYRKVTKTQQRIIDDILVITLK